MAIATDVVATLESKILRCYGDVFGMTKDRQSKRPVECVPYEDVRKEVRDKHDIHKR